MLNDKAVIYARVSSIGERQDTERQVHDLRSYATGAGLDVVRVFEEKASGAKVDRPVLEECLEFLKGGGAQQLLVSELSRLGRSLRQVLEVVEDLTAAGVNIFPGSSDEHPEGRRNAGPYHEDADLDARKLRGDGEGADCVQI